MKSGLTKTTLKRLSVCDCGFPTLKETIALGTEYEINPEITALCDFVCGGCGRKFEIKAVYVAPRGESRGGLLPKQLFEPAS